MLEYYLEILNSDNAEKALQAIDCPSVNKISNINKIIDFGLRNIQHQIGASWIVKYNNHNIGVIGLRFSPQGFVRSSIYLHDKYQKKGHFKPLYFWLWETSLKTGKPLQISIAINNYHSLKAHKTIWPQEQIFYVHEKKINTGNRNRTSWVIQPQTPPQVGNITSVVDSLTEIPDYLKIKY